MKTPRLEPPIGRGEGEPPGGVQASGAASAPTLDAPGLHALGEALRAAATRKQHRQAVALIGPQAWGQAVAALLTPSVGRRAFDSAEDLLSLARAELGTSTDHLIIDLHEDVNPNVLGALSGTVRGGGLMIFLLPTRWGAQPTRVTRLASSGGPPPTARFPQRLRQMLTRAALVLTPDAPLPEAPSPEGALAPTPPIDAFCRTDDQMRAVATLLKVAKGRKRRPAVLTSDRGRGKSSALGIAAGYLVKKGQRVLLTAPHRAAVEPVFERAAQLTGQPIEGNTLSMGAGALRFVPPGQLLAEPHEADVVFVDEAAALPIPILERILQRHARVAFATTVHGYEGTGRGFALRFQEALTRHGAGARAVQLSAPIRWAEGDPLERLMFDLLLLDASAAEDEAVRAAEAEACVVERLDVAALAEDEPKLRALFGLLVMAHYRTSPADLERLLDAGHMEVFALTWRGLVVGAALLGREGGLSEGLSAAIFEGRRRPRGHLLPETLSAHLGLEQAPMQRALRVIRVAIHPAVQARGLGGRLLEGITRFAERAGIDYLGSVFGATPQLLRFWTRQGLTPIRVGVQRGKSTGERAVVVIKPLSARAHALLDGARARFLAGLPDALTLVMPDMEPALVEALMREPADTPPALDAATWRDLVACAFGGRGFALTAWATRALVTAMAQSPEFATLTPLTRRLLIRKALLGHSWEALVEADDFERPKEAMAAFNEALRPWVLRWGGPEMAALAARFEPHQEVEG
ncbi:GNAT family N-acetyltransferase [Myxococcota bacterium]|nr:GNAT family N-acetyltransferase [Myxococcota bacterium]MBU1429037.1 GNAT family N-acetyltransferase [Myxococcota bacterium]MBU1898191.1 GNAT family N-acetyltransferase [Myxococcota bacterium]